MERVDISKAIITPSNQDPSRSEESNSSNMTSQDIINEGINQNNKEQKGQYEEKDKETSITWVIFSLFKELLPSGLDEEILEKIKRLIVDEGNTEECMKILEDTLTSKKFDELDSNLKAHVKINELLEIFKRQGKEVYASSKSPPLTDQSKEEEKEKKVEVPEKEEHGIVIVTKAPKHDKDEILSLKEDLSKTMKSLLPVDFEPKIVEFIECLIASKGNIDLAMKVFEDCLVVKKFNELEIKLKQSQQITELIKGLDSSNKAVLDSANKGVITALDRPSHADDESQMIISSMKDPKEELLSKKREVDFDEGRSKLPQEVISQEEESKEAMVQMDDQPGMTGQNAGIVAKDQQQLQENTNECLHDPSKDGLGHGSDEGQGLKGDTEMMNEAKAVVCEESQDLIPKLDISVDGQGVDEANRQVTNSGLALQEPSKPNDHEEKVELEKEDPKSLEHPLLSTTTTTITATISSSTKEIPKASSITSFSSSASNPNLKPNEKSGSIEKDKKEEAKSDISKNPPIKPITQDQKPQEQEVIPPVRPLRLLVVLKKMYRYVKWTDLDVEIVFKANNEGKKVSNEGNKAHTNQKLKSVTEKLNLKISGETYGLYSLIVDASLFEKLGEFCFRLTEEDSTYESNTFHSTIMQACSIKYFFDIEFKRYRYSYAPAQCPSEILESSIIYAYLISKLNIFHIICDDLIKQIPDRQSKQSIKHILDSEQIKSMLDNSSITLELSKIPIYFSFVLGKLIFWKEACIDDNYTLILLGKLYEMVNSQAILDQVSRLTSNLQKDYLINCLKTKMMINVRRNQFKDKTSYYAFIERFMELCEIQGEKEIFGFLLQIVNCLPREDADKQKMVKKLLPIISSLKIAEEIKLVHLLKLYGKSFVRDPLTKLQEMDTCLKGSLGVANPEPIAYELDQIKQEFNTIFQGVEFWSVLSKQEKIGLYRYLTSDSMNGLLKMAIKDSIIKTKLNYYVEYLFETNKQDDIDFLKVIFIEQYDNTLISSSQKTFIRKFLTRGYFAGYRISNETMIYFLNQVLFPYFVYMGNQCEEMGQNIRDWKELTSLSLYQIFDVFDNLFHAHKDNQSLEHNQNKSNILNIENNLQYISTQIIENLLDSDGYITIIKKYLKNALNWKSIYLKESFFDYIIIKLTTTKDKKETKKDVMNDILESILNDKENSNNPKASEYNTMLVERITIILSEEITIDDVKDLVLKDPSSSKIYISLLVKEYKKKDMKIIKSIKDGLNQVVNDITSYNITFTQIENVRNYDNIKACLMHDFLRYSNTQIDFREFFEELFHKIDELNSNIERIMYFLEHFGQIKALIIKKAQLESLKKQMPNLPLANFIPGNKNKDGSINSSRKNNSNNSVNKQEKSIIIQGFVKNNLVLFLPEFENFTEISAKIEKILISPFYKQFLRVNNDMSENDLIIACNTAYKQMIELFQSIIKELNDKTLTMNTIKKYFFLLDIDQFDEDMKEISKHCACKPQDLDNLKGVLMIYIKHPQLINFSKPLQDFISVLNLNNTELDTHAMKYYQISCNLVNESDMLHKPILVHDYVSCAKNLINELNANGIVSIDSMDLINRIIYELSTSKDLLKFLNILTKDNINELKDFVNDQEETYINRKTIKDLEYVWHFKSHVINHSNNLKVFVMKCKELLTQKNWLNDKGYDELSVCIKECIVSKNLIENTFIDMNNKEASFKFRIIDIMRECVVEINHKYTDMKDITLKPYNYPLKQLDEFRDKALLIINSNDDKLNQFNQVNIDLRILEKFTNFVEALNVILQSYEELENLGFFQKFIENTSINSIKFKIINGDFHEMESYKDKVKEYYEKWKDYIEKLYSESYLLSHFYGRQLKILHQVIIQDHNINHHGVSLCLWSNIDIIVLENYLTSCLNAGLIDEIKTEDCFAQLSFIKDVLENISPVPTAFDLLSSSSGLRDNSYLYEDDNDLPYVKLVNVARENYLFGMIPALTQDELKNIKLNQLLFCHVNTTTLEITAFLYRVFLNKQKLPYIVLGVDDLTPKIQNHFCDRFELLLVTLKPFKKYINLIIIGHNSNQRIIHYFYHNADFKKKIINNNSDNELAQHHVLQFINMVENFEIIYSKNAGLGKTHYILQQCNLKKLTPIYFPIAGNITAERICERLLGLDITKSTGLIIQLHNICDKKLLEEILFQLILFRSYKTQRYLFFVHMKFHMFIELQNLFQENYLENIVVLSVFKKTKFIKCIHEASAKDFKIDMHINIKFDFVMAYLKGIKQGTLANVDIVFEDFVENDPSKKISSQECIELLDEYFFKPLEKFKPSYIQLKAFLDIFYSNVRTFSASPFLSVETLKDIYSGLPRQEQEKLIKILRLDFVRILMENSREFVCRSVSTDDFCAIKGDIIQEINFGDKLKDFPLLIMKQGEEESDFCYSFVYNTVQKMPAELKIFILTQDRAVTANDLARWRNLANLDLEFISEDLTKKSPSQLLDVLQSITRVERIKPDQNYAITLDNFYKMCLIIQRMRARIPIVIMGETGVGKTALIKFLVENVYDDELIIVNIHAGINEHELIKKIEKIKLRAAEIKADALDFIEIARQYGLPTPPEKRLWVFFDEFNTTDEVGYISELITTNRFMGELIDANIIFLGACNPFRKRQLKNKIQGERVGIEKANKTINSDLLYKVLPPPESLIEIMWNYHELKSVETLAYIKTMLNIKYKPDQVVHVIDYTHSFIKERIEKSAVSLRDVDRFRRLYEWFNMTMPKQQALKISQRQLNAFSNYDIPRDERAFILAICFCYYMRLPSGSIRKEYLQIIEEKMYYEEDYMSLVFENEQLDLLSRMELPPSTALNLALRENIFSTFVCLMNKIPIIIVGMPGCSKSLAIRLLVTNLRGRNSHEEFFRNLEELSMVQFQGSESCTSEGVEKVFERAYRSLNLPRVIPTILFDEIGLAEVSVHNPLKVLHSHLEGRSKISFIGISNWELDAAKMGRFLLVLRPNPDQDELMDTATKIFESILGNKTEGFAHLIQTISLSYFEFIKTWRQKETSSYPDFFGLRDFYSLVKNTCQQIKDERVLPNDRQKVARILRIGIERNFDGQVNSISLFLKKISGHFYDSIFEEKVNLNVISIIQSNLQDFNSRCLLIIIKGEALIHLISHTIDLQNKNIINIHGSTFDQDKHSEIYNIRILSDIINYVEKGYIIIFKDLNNSIQTSLYDLYNKAYQRIGNKNYCRIAVGANYNPKCLVHQDFNCIVYIDENRVNEIDPPFLNRFEKHYLTLDRYLGHCELNILQDMKDWINMLFRDYYKNNGPLKKENFIVNVSDETLASLCIKNLQALKGKYENQDELLARALYNSKRETLRNSTTDFRFLIEINPEIKKDHEMYGLMAEVNQMQKTKTVYELCKEGNSKLIVYTYEQNLTKNLHFENLKTRVIKMVQMKCEQDIKQEIYAYFHSNEELCIIKMDYESEAIHLSLLLFLIENEEKLFIQHKSKNFIIILYYTRLSAVLVNDDVNPLQGISYLNGWSQIFLETLFKDDNYPIFETLSSLYSLINTLIDLKSIIINSLQNVFKRFNFKVLSELENHISLSEFAKFLLAITNNPGFVKFAEKYLLRLFENEQSKDWRIELLYDLQISNMALSIDEAIRLYTIEKVEDYLELMLKRLFELEAFMPLFPKYSLTILESFIPGIQGKFTNIKEFNLDYVDRLIQYVLPSTNNDKPSRAPNSIDITLNFPRLFPLSKLDEDFLLYQPRVVEDLDPNLYDMILKMKEIEQYNEDNEDYDIQLKLFKSQFKDLFKAKTILRKLDLEENGEIKMSNELNNPNSIIKEFYLLDIRNSFIQKRAKVNIEASLFLDNLIRYFLNENFTIDEYILTLLQSEILWKNLISTHSIFTSFGVSKSFIHTLYFPNKDQIFNNNKPKAVSLGVNKSWQAIYVKSFFDMCLKLFEPSENIIEMMNGSKNYSAILTNIYFWIIQLQNEYHKFLIEIPFELVIWRNLAELMVDLIMDDSEENMYNDLIKRINLQANMSKFIIIDDFLEHLKEIYQGQKQQQEEKHRDVSKFQATILFRYWIKNYSSNEEETEMIKRLLDRINNDKYFADYCGIIVKMLVRFENPVNAYAELAKLNDNIMIHINQSLIPSENTIDNNNNDINTNNLSIILTDYFDLLTEDPEILQIPQTESINSQKLLINFQKFSEFYHIIETNQYSTHIQLLYIIAFFRHYLRTYVLCLIEEKAYMILREIDALLSKRNYLADNLCVYTMKVLKMRFGMFENLRKFLFTIRRVVWIEKFEQYFVGNKENCGGLVVPSWIEDMDKVKDELRKKWEVMKEKGFDDQELFDGILSLAKTNHITKYMLLNNFLIDVYCEMNSKQKIENLKKLLKAKEAEINSILNKYQLSLMWFYLDHEGEELRYFPKRSKLSLEELNEQILMMNMMNWLVSLNEFDSPLTSLFFVNGKMPATQFGQYFNSQYVVTGLDNPYIEASKLLHSNSNQAIIYICSNQCDYIHASEDCVESAAVIKSCPFCKKALRKVRDAKQVSVRSMIDEPESSLEKVVERIAEKGLIKVIHQNGLIELNMKGYNRLTPKLDQNHSISRLGELSDNFLRLMLHFILYGMIALKWITVEEALKVIPLKSIDDVMEYLKKNMEMGLMKLKEYLDCCDWIVWILAMQQIVGKIIQDSGVKPNTYINRDHFEKAIEKCINDNLGEKKIKLIRCCKLANQYRLNKLDLILSEHELTPEYKFLQLLRITKLPSLSHVMNDHKELIKSRYPIIYECITSLPDLEDISRLKHILRFTNDLMKIVYEGQKTRNEVKNLKISELIEKLPQKNAEEMTKLLGNFLQSWNNLNLGSINYNNQALGNIPKYSKNTPAMAFLIDTLADDNPQGKILVCVINELCKKQNLFLKRISASSASSHASCSQVEPSKHDNLVKFYDNMEYLPQNVDMNDIIELNKDQLEEICLENSGGVHVYGNGMPIYNFNRIQFNLMLKIIGKKIFLLDINLYQNVKFYGENFMKNGKYIDYISQIRSLGLNNQIPNQILLEDKLKLIQENVFYSTLKQVLGSLERLMLFYKNLAVKNITISQYVARFKFNSISKLITDEEPIKDYDISCIISLYEYIEKMIIPNVWKVLPEVYKAKKLNNEEHNIVVNVIKELKERKIMLSLDELSVALSRFVSRCLLLGNFNETELINEWLFTRQDFWSFPYDSNSVEPLCKKLPKLTVDKIFDLYDLIEKQKISTNITGHIINQGIIKPDQALLKKKKGKNRPKQEMFD